MKNVLSVEEFEAELNTDKTVVAYFGASWCGPCKKVKPTVEAVAEECRDTMVFLYVSLEDVPELSETYLVKSIPTFIPIKNGEAGTRLTGVVTAEQLKDL